MVYFLSIVINLFLLSSNNLFTIKPCLEPLKYSIHACVSMICIMLPEFWMFFFVFFKYIKAVSMSWSSWYGIDLPFHLITSYGWEIFLGFQFLPFVFCFEFEILGIWDFGNLEFWDFWDFLGMV